MGNREKRFLLSLEKHDTQLAIRLEDVWAEFMALKNALQRAIESGHKRQAQQLVLQIRALMAGQPQGRRESTGLPLELRERFAQPRFKPSVRELLNMIEMQAWILRNSDLGAGSRSGGLLKRDTGAPKALRINIAPPRFKAFGATGVRAMPRVDVIARGLGVCAAEAFQGEWCAVQA